MNHAPNMVGMGCFAKIETLHRVFNKALGNFILGTYEDIYLRQDRILNDENLAYFFRSVISHGTGRPDQVNQASGLVPGSVKITGFFLGLKRRSLHLVVFFSADGQRQAKYTTRLENFTRLREKRLH